MRARWIRYLGASVVVVSLLATVFAYGFLTHRERVFPYDLIRSAKATLISLSGREVDLTQTWLFASAPAEGVDGQLHDELDALGYLQGYNPVPPRTGVVTHQPELVQPGLNLYVSADSPRARLMTMDGEILHTWEVPFEQICPDDIDPTLTNQLHWRRAQLLDDGSLVAVFEFSAIVKLDPDSNVLWHRCEPYHHDLSVGSDGQITVLRRNRRISPLNDWTPVYDDEVVVLSEAGELISSLSILDAFLDSDHASVLAGIDPEASDILHTNAVKVLDGRFAEQHPAFAGGNLLLSIRNLHTIAVLDPGSRKVVWTLSGIFRGQHEPVLLPSGNLLIFDNWGNRGKSRVIEIDPVTQQIAWSYAGGTEELYSRCCGTNQRLPNGNTLITVTAKGQVLEVTPEGQIAWEFFNPARAGEHAELIAVLFDTVRVDADAVAGWLDR